ncbi:cytochrome c [Variovorax sp. M-6]|uniref:SorU family sulfite dehydrogenase c-type cytochrome subunit n=1 Tax=Variovorax sp. M-6 TaxID=3233041 RepID=UPI003F9C7ED5
MRSRFWGAAVLAGLWMAGAHAQPATDEGRKLFLTGATPACALCHTLKKAGATGQIGPDLDELQPDAARVEKAIRNGIGPMPAFKSLTDEQIRTLARYVASATGAAP